jgi:NAD(P)-dependent dehydrogenase (short-subunit alcohol dehydrogenase family)
MSSAEQLASPNSFTNRTVIVTGGAGALGRAISLAFAKAGANVVVNDFGSSPSGAANSSSPAQSLVDEILALGFSAISDTHSVTDGEKIIQTAIDRFGRVDVLVNTAAIIHYGPVETQSPDIIRKVFEVNALGAMTMVHYAWPYFQRQRYGRVINFTSESIFGMPQSTAYVLSKGALVGVTKTLALEGAPFGITVNCAAPCAYSRLGGSFIEDLPPRVREEYVLRYTGVSNVPMILALSHEKNDISGKIFSLGAYAVGRMVLGSVAGPKKVRTMEDCFQRQEEILGKGKEVAEPDNAEQFFAFKATYIG